MLFKTILIPLVTVLLSTTAFAQTANDETITQKFFEAFKSDPGKAYNELFADNKCCLLYTSRCV